MPQTNPDQPTNPDQLIEGAKQENATKPAFFTKPIVQMKKWLGVGGVAIVGIAGWFILNRSPAPTQVLCPIATASVNNAECKPYTGQRYRKTLYRLMPAVELGKNEIGLYQNPTGDLSVFTDVGFHAYPQPYSVVYPQDLLLYKTERATNDPAKCPNYLTRYGLCDTPIDRVVFSDGIEGSIDLAISFKLNETSDNLEELYDIGGPDRFIELFKQVVRGNRQLTSINAKVANTAEGAKQIEQSFRQALKNWELSHLFDVETVSIRGVVVGGPNYRQQQEVQAAKIAQQELELKSLDFERSQRLQDAESFAQSIQTICQSIPPERCPEMLWVLTHGGQLQPFLNSEGNFTSITPSVNPTNPTAPPSPQKTDTQP